MTRLSLPTLLIAALVVAGGLTGCAEAQRMVNDAGRIVDTAGGAASGGDVAQTTAASWTTTAQESRGQTGTLAFDCPAISQIPSDYVHGSNPYADVSPVCIAGAHAGVVTTRGGRVLIQMRAPQSRYAGSTRNGIRSIDSGAPGRASFVIVTN